MEKKISKTRLPVKLVFLLAMALLVPLAHANTLNNGNSVPPSPLFPTGAVVGSTSGTIFAITFTATFTEQVIADSTNIFCLGCYTFVYTFTDLGPNPNERYTMYNFAGFMLNVGTDPFGPHNPTLIDRTVGGAVVGFNFPAADEITPGETTVGLVIQTNATHITNGLVSVQDGSTGTVAALAPLAVPEPSSLALMGGGLSLVGGLLRRFRIEKNR